MLFSRPGQRLFLLLEPRHVAVLQRALRGTPLLPSLLNTIFIIFKDTIALRLFIAPSSLLALRPHYFIRDCLRSQFA